MSGGGAYRTAGAGERGPLPDPATTTHRQVLRTVSTRLGEMLPQLQVAAAKTGQAEQALSVLATAKNPAVLYQAGETLVSHCVGTLRELEQSISQIRSEIEQSIIVAEKQERER